MRTEESNPASAARRGRWLIAGTVTWAVLLVGLTCYSSQRDEPTVREQRSLQQAAPVVDRAIGELVRAAGSEAVLEISDRRVVAGCRITPLRAGATLEQTVTMRTRPEQGPALLEQLKQRLPADYRVGIRPGADGTARDLRADAGEFVVLTGGVSESGVVTVTAATGCRPTSSDDTLAESPPGLPIDAEPGRLLAVLKATDVSPAVRVAVSCPDRGAARTARATGLAAPAGPPPATALPRPAGTVVVADRSDLYAYRDGQLSVVVETVDGDLRVAVTTGCPADR